MSEHYRKGKIETWDWMEAGMAEDQFRGFLLGNIYKYLQRYRHKEGCVDLGKARNYISRLMNFERTVEAQKNLLSEGLIGSEQKEVKTYDIS